MYVYLDLLLCVSVSHQPVLSISGAMGLDQLDLDFSSVPKKHPSQKWSQIGEYMLFCVLLN